jgi:hypothetical protein
LVYATEQSGGRQDGHKLLDSVIQY